MAILSLEQRPRDETVGSTVRAAVSEERRRHRRWLHDRTLQVLEYLAAGGYRAEAPDDEMRQVAARAADELRAFIEDGAEGTDLELVEALHDLIAEERLRCFHTIELVVGRTDGSVAGPGAAALLGAAAEALANVRKHARATRVVVWCETHADNALVTVLDDGVGFDLERTPFRAGLKHSVASRMYSHGGSAHVESWPGDGTLVSLRLGSAPAPARAPVAEVAA